MMISSGFWLYMVILFNLLSTDASAGPLKQCGSAISKSGWALATWAFSSGKGEDPFEAMLEALCKEGHCYSMCALTKASVLTGKQEQLRVECAKSGPQPDQKLDEACKRYLSLIGESPDLEYRHLCLMVGGRTCYDGAAGVGNSKPEIMEVVQIKLACKTGVKEACDFISNYRKKEVDRAKSNCTTERFEGCHSLYEEMLWAGKYTEAADVAVNDCISNPSAYACGWYKAKNFPTIRAHIDSTLKRLCLEKAHPEACYFLAKRDAESGRRDRAFSLMKVHCEQTQKAHFKEKMCAFVGEAFLEQGKVDQAEIYMKTACDSAYKYTELQRNEAMARKDKPNQIPRPFDVKNCGYMKKIEAARLPAQDLAENVRCYKEGHLKFYDKDLRPVVEITCKNGFRNGPAKLSKQYATHIKGHGIYHDELIYKNGLVNGTMKSPTYSQPKYTYIPVKDGVVHGTAKGPDAVYEFNGGLLHGRHEYVSYRKEKKLTFENGLLVGSAKDTVARCGDRKSEALKLIKLVDAKFDTQCSDQPKIGREKSTDGTIRRTTETLGSKIVTRYFTEGMLVLQKECRKDMAKLDYYGELLMQHQRGFPLFKRISYQRTKGELSGLTRVYKFGRLEETSQMNEGRVTKSTFFRHGTPCS